MTSSTFDTGQAAARLVDGVTKTGLDLDRTTGQLSAYTIPQPRR